MAYRRRLRARGFKAKIASRRAYRKAMAKPKRVLAKTYANTVGQIAYMENSTRPHHRGLRGRRSRRGFRRSSRRRRY